MAKPSTATWNAAHAYAADCECYVPLTEGMGSPKDFVTDTACTRSAGETWTTTPDGAGLAHSGAGTGVVLPSLGSFAAMTAWCRFKPTDTGTARCPATAWDGVTNNAWVFFSYHGTPSSSRFRLGISFDLNLDGAVLTSGTWYDVFMVWYGSVLKVFGGPVGGTITEWASADNGGAASVAAGTDHELGAYAGGNPFLGDTSGYAVWSRAFSSGEVGTFAADPWGPIAATDTTPPTAGTWASNTAGTSITATLSESGCTPASGSGGFTLGGTSATVSSWAISGTTLTLTLSGALVYGETVTVSYDRANTTDDIADAATNYLANITTASVTNNKYATLTAGTASFVTSGPAGISVSATASSNGDGAGPSYQWERNENGGSYSDLSGKTSLSCTDSTATTAGVVYRYRCKQTRGTDTVTTNAVVAQVYEGGAIGAGSVSRARLVNAGGL
jgi:hypothetical protein